MSKSTHNSPLPLREGRGGSLTRKQIDEEIDFLFNKAQITHSERKTLLGDMVEGKYKRPEILM